MVWKIPLKSFRNCNYSYYLAFKIITPLHLRSKVSIAPSHVRSNVCIAPFYVRSKVCKFAPHLDGSNADFTPHMEGSHADFAPHMERRQSFRDLKIAKTANSANLKTSQDRKWLPQKHLIGCLCVKLFLTKELCQKLFFWL